MTREEDAEKVEARRMSANSKKSTPRSKKNTSKPSSDSLPNIGNMSLKNVFTPRVEIENFPLWMGVYEEGGNKFCVVDMSCL